MYMEYVLTFISKLVFYWIPSSPFHYFRQCLCHIFGTCKACMYWKLHVDWLGQQMCKISTCTCIYNMYNVPSLVCMYSYTHQLHSPCHMSHELSNFKSSTTYHRICCTEVMYPNNSVYMYLLQVLEATRRMYTDTPSSGQ